MQVMFAAKGKTKLFALVLMMENEIHKADSSSEGNTRAVSSMFRVGRFVQQGVENLVGRCVVVALARP
jgi:hypothetical protein